MALPQVHNGIRQRNSSPLSSKVEMHLAQDLILAFRQDKNTFSKLRLSCRRSNKYIEWAKSRARRRQAAPGEKYALSKNEEIWSDNSVKMMTRIGRCADAGQQPTAWPLWQQLCVTAAAASSSHSKPATACPRAVASVTTLPSVIQCTTGMQPGPCIRVSIVGSGGTPRTLAFLTPSHCAVSKPVTKQAAQTDNLLTVCDISVVFLVLRRYWGASDAWPAVQLAWHLVMQRVAQSALIDPSCPATSSSKEAQDHVEYSGPQLSPWHPVRVSAFTSAAEKATSLCWSALTESRFALASSRTWLLQK